MIRSRIAFIRYLVQHKLLMRFCYFLKLKHRFSNSLYYNYTSGRICRVVGHSRKLVEGQLRFFLERKWCAIHHGHLKFESIATLCRLEGVKAVREHTIELELNNVKKANIQLKRLLFEDNLRKQEYMIKRRSDLHNPNNLKSHKSAVKYFRATGKHTGESNGALIMSLNTLSTLYSCSISTAQRIKNQFITQGWYTFIRRFTKICTATRYGYLRGIMPYKCTSVFLMGANVYKSEPSVVIRGAMMTG